MLGNFVVILSMALLGICILRMVVDILLYYDRYIIVEGDVVVFPISGLEI